MENGQWTADTSGLRLRVSGAVSVSLAENSADLTLTLDDQPCAEILSLLDGETFDLILEEEVSIETPPMKSKPTSPTLSAKKAPM